MPLTPSIMRIAQQARDAGHGPAAMLEHVRDHARTYGNRLEFGDAVDLVRLYVPADQVAGDEGSR